MKKIALALMCSLIATASQAAIIVTQTPSPTTVNDGTPTGGTTWTIGLEATEGEVIFGVDAEFVGDLGQVNPLGMATPFQNLNGFFGDRGASEDSQFLFNSDQLSPPALAVEDAPNRLAAAITNLPGATQSDGRSVQLAQIALGPNGADYRFSIDVRDQSGAAIGNPTLSGSIPDIPEPATMGLLGLAMVGLLGLRRRS